MDSEIFKLLIFILGTVYFMLPAYVANLSGLAFGGGTPVDGGKNWSDGRRIIVGVVLGIIGTYYGDLSVLTGGVIDLPVYGSIFGGLILGFLMAFGALLGDAVGSFFKRRMGLESGQAAPFMDQLDFVLGALLLSLIVVRINLQLFITIVLLSLILHLGSNIVAYLFGIKDVWY